MPIYNLKDSLKHSIYELLFFSVIKYYNYHDFYGIEMSSKYFYSVYKTCMIFYVLETMSSASLKS